MTVQEEPIQGLSHGYGQRMHWIFREAMPKMLWDQMERRLNQALEPAGWTTSSKLWEPH